MRKYILLTSFALALTLRFGLSTFAEESMMEKLNSNKRLDVSSLSEKIQDSKLFGRI